MHSKKGNSVHIKKGNDVHIKMYSDTDIELVISKIDEISEKIENEKLYIYEPTRDEQIKGINIVLEYVKNNHRKIYGGYAQNQLVMHKEPKDNFYPESNIPDIDYYSAEPLEDVKNICDLLHEAKIGENVVEGREAQHSETYKVFLNFADACDISYVPKYIFHKIPFITIDGINYVHPYFIYIDLYRVLSEPHFSSRTWGKHFARLCLLQKHYPLKVYNERLNKSYDVKNDVAIKVNKFILDKVKNRDSYVLVGQCAYNYYCDEVKGMNNNNISYINMPLIQIISTNYIEDAAELIGEIKDFESKITFTEFYPFWQFTGYSVVVYYDGIALLHMMSHNDRCTPIKKVTFKTFYDNKVVESKKDYVQLGSFDTVFLMNLVSGFRCRVMDLPDKLHYHDVFTGHLIEMRNYYFSENGKNLLDDTLFQSFIPGCVGRGEDPLKDRLRERRDKALEGKLIVYKYIPGRNMTVPNFKFANTSGNAINKEINLKVTKYIKGVKSELTTTDLTSESISEDS